MTKKEKLISDILENDSSYEEAELKEKTIAELEKMISEKEDKSLETEIDLEKLKQEMYEKVLKELSEKQNTEEQPIEEIQKKIQMPNNRNRKEQIDKQMLVPVMNVTNGKLIYQSKKTGSEFMFERYGDIEYMEVYEILTMRSSQRRFLDEPFIIVLDDEVAEYLGLSKQYKKMTHATEIDNIFSLPTERFKEIIETAPRGLAHLIVGKAREKLQAKQLDSVQKVKILEDIYKIELGK